MSASDHLQPHQFFPDDTTPSHYGFVESDDGPQNAGEDVTPDLEQEIMVHPGMRLHTEQHEMSTGAVEHYQSGGAQLERLTISGDGEQRPVVASYRERQWLVDGNHRVAASRLRGDPGIKAWHVPIEDYT